jgi:hypothetical protein
MLAHENLDSTSEVNRMTSRKPAIISYDFNGEDMRLEEIPYHDVESFAILKDGSTVYSITRYNSATQNNEQWLTKVDISGKEVFSVDVSMMIPDNSALIESGVSKIACDAEERIYLKMSPYVVVVSSNSGKKLFHVSVPANESIQLIRDILPVGENMAIQYQEGNLVFRYIDAKTKKIGEDVYTPEGFDIGTNTAYQAGENEPETLYYYKTNTGLYRVNKAEKSDDITVTEVINWLNSDVFAPLGSSIKVINNDRIFYRGNDPLTSNIVISALTRIPDNEVFPKYIIELAYVSSMFQIDELLAIIVKFNQDNENYKVTLTDYKQLSGDKKGEELELFINTQFAIGKIPDLFMFDYNFSGKNFEDKGLFFNLYDYMDNDIKLNRDNFIKCVLPAGEVNGNLYYLPASFRVRTLVGMTENIGGLRDWNISDFLDYAKSLDNGIKMLLNETRDNVYNLFIKQCLNEFIDFELGTCSFDEDLFIRLINYAKSLPNTPDTFYSYEASAKEFIGNTTILHSIYLNDFLEFIQPTYMFGTEDLTFIGYPSGNAKIEIPSSYAVSAMSEKEIRDGAWEFLRYLFLSSDFFPTESLGDRFPSTIEAFYKFAENKMRLYYLISSNGGLHVSNSSESIQELMDKHGGHLVRITQETVDAIFTYFESIENKSDIDKKIEEIVDEEIQYFFADAKTAEETATIIQSRVSIYLSESQ